ncbi:MAG: DUF4342 domain-containing protein [Oscillospiraceae bacterium]
MNQILDFAEKLVEKTGVSYAEAKEALENNGWDILEAIIWLESQGKVKDGKTTSAYTTQKKEQTVNTDKFKESAKSFGDWICSVINKGNTNCLEMYRRGEHKLSIPITVFIVLLIFGFWVVLPLMVISLFFECRYSFSGSELGKESINSAMGKATDIADGIKTEIKKTENTEKK